MDLFPFIPAAEAATAEAIIDKVLDIIVNPLVALLFTVALIIFLWGVFQYLRKGADPKVRQEGAQHILWGIVGLVIMMSVYGIIRLVVNTFGFETPSGTVDLQSIGK